MFNTKFMIGDLVTLKHDDFLGLDSKWLGRDGFVIFIGEHPDLKELVLTVGLHATPDDTAYLIEAPPACFEQSENVAFKSAKGVMIYYE